jgi:hypothetical protein
MKLDVKLFCQMYSCEGCLFQDSKNAVSDSFGSNHVVVSAIVSKLVTTI